MSKWRVRGTLTVQLYVTVNADTEDEAMLKGYEGMDESLDDLELPGVTIQEPDIGIQEARKIK